MTDKTKEQLELEKKLEEEGLGGDDEVVVDVDDETEELEIEVDESDESEEEQEIEQESEYSEEEIQAKEGGWKPKDEWEGAPEEWVTAKQFLRNGEYLRKIHNQNRKIKQLDDVVTTLAKQQKKIFDAGYDKAKKELKLQLREANREGDDATAEVIEDRLEKLEERKVEDTKALEVKEEKAPIVAPEFESWVKRNDWFVKHSEMRAYAEAEGIKHAMENPHKTNTEIYAYVTETVKKRFPERFGMAKKTTLKRESPVDGGSKLTTVRKGESTTVRVSLSAEEKAVGRTLVAKGIYKNLNEYAVDLKKLGAKS